MQLTFDEAIHANQIATERLPHGSSIARECEAYRLRQAYIDSLNLGWATKYFKRRYYTLFAEKNSVAMAIASKLATNFGIKGTRATLVVSFKAFGFAKNERELLSILRDHEGVHAKHFYDKPRLFASKDPEGESITEYYACRKQLLQLQAQAEDVSSEFIENTRKWKKHHYQCMRRERTRRKKVFVR